MNYFYKYYACLWTNLILTQGSATEINKTVKNIQCKCDPNTDLSTFQCRIYLNTSIKGVLGLACIKDQYYPWLWPLWLIQIIFIWRRICFRINPWFLAQIHIRFNTFAEHELVHTSIWVYSVQLKVFDIHVLTIELDLIPSFVLHAIKVC